MKKQTILVYGDSLTWGMDPASHDRLAGEARWVTVLQRELGSSVEVIAEGLRSRMFYGENPHKSELDGYVQYGPILGSHLPADVVVIMLGTNDCSAGANKDSKEIAAAIPLYVEKTGYWADRCHVEMPQMVFISPHHIIEKIANDDPRQRFLGSEEKSKQLADAYKEKTAECGVHFFDAAKVIRASESDGIHLDAENNKILGKAFAEYLRGIM